MQGEDGAVGMRWWGIIIIIIIMLTLLFIQKA